MKWINVEEYLPGKKNWENDAIVVRLSNFERHFLSGRNITGVWLASDGKTETKVTHWLLLESPQDV